MTCSDVQKALPELLDDAPDGAIQAQIAGHLQRCTDCSDLVSDLKLIASESRQLAECEDPPARVWVRIAAELRAEGVIRDDAASQPHRPVLVPSPVANSARRWSMWWLAPVAAAILAAGTYTISHTPATQVAKQDTPKAAPVTKPAPVVAQTLSPASPTTAPQQLAQKEPVSVGIAKSKIGKSASQPVIADLSAQSEASPAGSDDQQFLSMVSTNAPSMRATYESQLRAVNSDIRETEAYVRRFPADADARQHLMDAYQQKTMLYQIALDHIQ